MASISSILLHCCLVLVLFLGPCSATMPKPKSAIEHQPQPWSLHTYIVQINHLAKPMEFQNLDRWYASMVASHSPRAATNSSSRIIHTYDTVIDGFAVRFMPEEARRMSRIAGVSGVYRDTLYQTQTTRSPVFLGLESVSGAWQVSDYGDGVIIGVVDTGIWPAHASFNASGLGPVRPSWRGGCDGDGQSNSNASLCTDKLVGARSFVYGADGRRLPPVDTDGHGTHVASTAAGSHVPGADVLGFAPGTATGVAPNARVAAYRACHAQGCAASSVVAAIDAATRDGVDILCVSLGSEETRRPFYDDVVAVALFRAEQTGVVVIVPGGNTGPQPSTVTNAAPWVTTVGAATVDRVLSAGLHLPTGVVIAGQSLYDVKAAGETTVPLVTSNCNKGDMIPDAVMGRVVVCREERLDAEFVKAATRAGAAGLVAVDGRESMFESVRARTFGLPGVVLAYTDAQKLRDYMESTPYPTASLSFSCDTVVGENPAPIVAGFSSRGPSQAAEEILKPDLIAPGVNIVAAWPGLADDIDGEPRFNFNMLSGSSMACAHVAGVAALVSKLHRDWTPAMIRSSMMTTTWITDRTGEDILDAGVGVGTAATPLVQGAGLVRPVLALDPGLVYDAGTQDYVSFLCSINYTVEQVRRFVPGLTKCTRTLPGGANALNYPSFVVVFDNTTRVIALTRKVTSVSPHPQTYRAVSSAPAGVKVTVTPSTLKFKKQYESKTYTVVFESGAGAPRDPKPWDFGHITWRDWSHQVRSPVAFTWKY